MTKALKIEISSKLKNTGKTIGVNEMGKSISFDDYLINKLSKDPEQAVDYLKLAIEEGDLDLLRLSIDNLLRGRQGQ